MLYFSNFASICSHALILLSPTRWFVMIGWRTSLCLCAITSLQPFAKHVWIVVLAFYKHRLHPVLQTRLECRSLSAYTHLFPALCVNHLWVMVPGLGTSTCLLLFGFRFLVWIADLCLCTLIRLQHCSNVFDYSSCLLPSRPHQNQSLHPGISRFGRTQL